MRARLCAGGYNPGVPGERVVWAALLGALPPAWALVGPGRRRGTRPRYSALASVSGITDAGQETG